MVLVETSLIEFPCIAILHNPRKPNFRFHYSGVNFFLVAMSEASSLRQYYICFHYIFHILSAPTSNFLGAAAS